MNWGVTGFVHFTLGLISGLLSSVLPIASLILALLFIAYQYFDRLDEGSGGTREIVEFTVGYIIGVGGVLYARIN